MFGVVSSHSPYNFGESLCYVKPYFGQVWGFLGSPNHTGNGITCRLAGMTVFTCAEFTEYDAEVTMGVGEGIVDMAGPVASKSPFGDTINLALVFKRKPETTTAVFATAIRMAGFKAAAYLAGALKKEEPSHRETYNLKRQNGQKGLPRVAPVYLLSSLSLPCRESFVYGQPVNGMLPTVLHPNEVLDGAVVGNYMVYGGVRNPTYFYQNNPVLLELYRKHNKEVDLAGVIITRAGSTSHDGKLIQAESAAGIGELLGLNGAVVSANAGGQQIIDFMFVCQQLEKKGIKTSGILAEMADTTGTDFSFALLVPEANALVSAGNREELVELPPVEQVIGGDRILGREDWAKNRQSVPLRLIYCSGTQTGAWNIGAVPF